MFILTGHAVDYGTEFVTAFPENLAYYFPAQLILQLKITTFLPNTNVNIIMNGTTLYDMLIDPPQVKMFDIANAEISQFGVSGNSIRICSNNIITVLSYNQRGDSMQSNVVPPTTNLGMVYLVPSPNYTELAVKLNTYNASLFTSSTTAPMDFGYRLLIINADDATNTVTVTQNPPGGQSSDITFTLGPFALTLLSSNDFWFKVSSTAEVAVILTNPCMDTQNCRCNLVAHQLRPIDFLGTDFLCPVLTGTNQSLFVTSTDSVDLSSGSDSRTVVPGSIGLLPFLPGLDGGMPVLTTSRPASVIVLFPGLIIDLLPNTMFAGCYLVHTTMQFQANALLLVETAQKNDIYMDASPLSGATWNDISGTMYSWALIDLTSCKSCVIWHPTTQIAVYVFEGSGVKFGGPAISLNDEPGKVPLEVLQSIKPVMASDTIMS